MWVSDLLERKIFSYNMPDDADATLSGLAVSPNDVSGFEPEVTAYHVGVANDVTEVAITATTPEPGATIEIDGSAVASGSAHTVSLAEGRNDIAITVTAGDGRTTRGLYRHRWSGRQHGFRLELGQRLQHAQRRGQ